MWGTFISAIGARSTMRKLVPRSPLFRFSRERFAIIDEVIERVTSNMVRASEDNTGASLSNLLNEAAYVELSRHAADGVPSTDEGFEFWTNVVRSIVRLTKEDNAELVRRAVGDYTRETAGNFRPAVQKVALNVIPRSVSLVLGGRRGGSWISTKALAKGIAIEGDVKRLNELARHGTLVFVATHSSRLDAGLLGYAVHLAGLPAMVHGADRVLYQQPLMSFFMSNLGAYKVDRRRKHTLYTQVLKTYSQILLERGYHSFFFPTGGRSRSNRIQQHLKLGLMGTGLKAWTQTVINGDDRPVFIIPVTMNYNLILEAETLAADYVDTPDGDSYEIIEKDEFTSVRRVVAYMRASLTRSPFLTVRFGAPMDPFGNEVSRHGESLDNRGRVHDPRRYLWREGVPVADRKRGRAYTRGLGRKVLKSWKQNNVISPMHIVAMALFEYVCRQHPTWDVRGLLLLARGDSISRVSAEGETERLLRLVRQDAEEGKYCLTEGAKEKTAHEMLQEALHLFGAYHTTPVIEEERHEIRLMNLRLLYFYSNRLRGYDLERRLRDAPGGY